uniref:SHSP domain-containing protein n=1 Tax=Haemonchus contortus TaxID=6289 RepID=A0A7I4XTD4_HAECO
MSLCILPFASEAILPRLLDDVFSELDDAFNQFYQIEQISSPASRRREGKKSLMGQVSDDGTKLAITLDVSKFKPDELKVNIDGRVLSVEGKQEVKEGSSYTARSFLRQWTVPQGVDVEQIRSTLTDDGHLAIEVPKAKPAITARSIPIQKANDQPAVKSN